MWDGGVEGTDFHGGVVVGALSCSVHSEVKY